MKNEQEPQGVETAAYGLSALNAGLEGVDPEFIREIELSLLAMTDQAIARLADAELSKCLRPVVLAIMRREIEKSEELLRRIADWFEPSN